MKGREEVKIRREEDEGERGGGGGREGWRDGCRGGGR